MSNQEEMKDTIYINGPIPKGLSHCEACGRFVRGNCMVCHAKRDSRFVCDVMCGLKVVDAS